MIRATFDKLMRNYAKVFFILVLIEFISNEFTPKSYNNIIIIIWITIHLFLLLSACLCQKKLKRIIDEGIDAGNLGAYVAVSQIVAQDRLIDNVRLILYGPFHIPEEIKTQDVNAQKVLEFSQQHPYVYDFADTVYDYNFLRFSWLTIQKKNIEALVSVLRAGDMILYHRNGSIIGAAIRFFTRCYWEHVSFYEGNGMLIDVSLRGVVRIPIEPWIQDDQIMLGVLRPSVPYPEQGIKFTQKHVGDKYAYRKVFILWWRIVTGKVRLGLITPLIFIINLIQLGIALFICLAAPQFTRLQIFLFALSAPYFFSSIHHRLAYAKDLDTFKNIFNAQSRH